MKERPILFSGPMVRALLDGKKTQTRRIVKPQPDTMYEYKNNPELLEFLHPVTSGTYSRKTFTQLCKFGQIGDRLWVRETWCNYPMAGNDGDSAVIYRATNDCIPPGRWRPSIFMARSDSRITLEITGVRVERVQDISENDAIAEGAQCAGFPASLTNRGAFGQLWQKINGPESWAANPWVWCIEFRKVEAGNGMPSAAN